MDLFLIQHGEAKSEAEDPERSLTEYGAGTVRQMAAWAAQARVKVGQIRHSGKKRAEQTAVLLADRLNPILGIQAVAGLNPNDDARPVAEALQQEQGPLMLVGHLPFLSRLAGLLVVGDPERAVVTFRQAGITCLAREESQWTVRWVMLAEHLKGS